MKQRREPELMDDPGLDPGEHRAALHALRRVNRWLGVEQRLLRAVTRIVDDGMVSFLDVGTGGGGWLAAAATAAQADGMSWRLVGMDRSQVALIEARSMVGASQACVVAGDAHAIPIQSNSIDVVVCSLLLHHFDPSGVISALREAARIARRAVVIGDLDRNRIAWALTWLVTRATSRSRVFRVDGPRSVRAAYRPAEMYALADQAGLNGASIRSVFPNRWILTWKKDV